jgi:hypothetical protein
MQMNVKEATSKKSLDSDGDEMETHKVTMEGTNGQGGYSKVKIKLSIESENKKLLEEYVPMDVFESRMLKLGYVNKTLSDFAEPDEIEV